MKPKIKVHLSSSKSLYNRALVAREFTASPFKIQGNSLADDITHMSLAIQKMREGEREIYCGEAGTVFRFLAAFASRTPGKYLLTGSQRLLARPHSQLLDALDQLSVSTSLSSLGLEIDSNGWSWQGPILIPMDKSSQFATAILISAWGLSKTLEIEIPFPRVSEAYWTMTLNQLRLLGMSVCSTDVGVQIAPAQSILCNQLLVEIDISSAFVIATLGLLNKGVIIADFPDHPLQPDSRFLEIFQRMGALPNVVSGDLMIPPCYTLCAINEDLSDCPDLFPVLAVLCSFGEGTSHFTGVSHLFYKESNRLLKTEELLSKMGVEYSRSLDGFTVKGEKDQRFRSFDFDSDQDHRMAFAAAIAMSQGHKINLGNPNVVKKSFPEFWDIYQKVVL